MPNFFTIKDGWSLDEQLGNMLRELDVSQTTSKADEFRNQLRVLMQEYRINDATIIEWIEKGVLE